MILVVTTAHDPHCDIVCRELNRMREPFVRFNTEDFPTVAQVHVGVSSGAFFARLNLPDGTVDMREIHSVWYRRPVPPVIDPALGAVEARNVAQAETQSLLRQLWAAIADRFWMSWPMNIRRADQKLLQLRVAIELGFELPDTLISQSASEMRQFAREAGGHVAIKTISGVIMEGPPIRAVYTRCLSENELPDDARARLCPTLLQRYVDKAAELRVTVVGHNVFAAEMDTQADAKTMIDWRRGSPLRVPHRAISLAPEVEDRCRELVRRLGLSFGAIDMIRTRSGNLVFLEINPNGQWAWIEGLTGLPIAASIAEMLASPPQLKDIKGQVGVGLINDAGRQEGRRDGA